jgi:hypothetical protein
VEVGGEGCKVLAADGCSTSEAEEVGCRVGCSDTVAEAAVGLREDERFDEEADSGVLLEDEATPVLGALVSGGLGMDLPERGMRCCGTLFAEAGPVCCTTAECTAALRAFEGEAFAGVFLDVGAGGATYERETERQRDRETERQRDRETERQRDSETARELHETAKRRRG